MTGSHDKSTSSTVEEPLTGGNVNAVVRVGDTVRRTPRPLLDLADFTETSNRPSLLPHAAMYRRDAARLSCTIR